MLATFFVQYVDVEPSRALMATLFHSHVHNVLLYISELHVFVFLALFLHSGVLDQICENPSINVLNNSAAEHLYSALENSFVMKVSFASCSNMQNIQATFVHIV